MSALRAQWPLLIVALVLLLCPSAAATHIGLEARPSWDPEAPARGDTLSVQVTFVNVGNATSPAGGVGRVVLNGAEIAANELPALEPGRRTTMVARPVSVGEGDTATLEVFFRIDGIDALERRDVIVLADPGAAPATPTGPAPTGPTASAATPGATATPATPADDPARGTPAGWGAVALVAVAIAASATKRRR